MHLTVPVAILGFSSLSMTAPSEGLNGRSDGDEIRGPSDWAGSSLDDNHQLNMKSHHVPVMQCNNYHSPVDARAGKEMVWKFCNENDRGTIYIHETTPYANRDDVELNPRECKTHNSPGDKHKSFQVCNRGFHALRMQNIRILSSVIVREDPRLIKHEAGKIEKVNPAQDVNHEEVKVDATHEEFHEPEQFHEPESQKLNEPHFEMHELKHEEKHEFKHEEKHEIKKGGQPQEKHELKQEQKQDENRNGKNGPEKQEENRNGKNGPEEQEENRNGQNVQEKQEENRNGQNVREKQEENRNGQNVQEKQEENRNGQNVQEKHGEKHEPQHEEIHVVNHDEKHDKLKHEEMHVVKSENMPQLENFGGNPEGISDERYVDGQGRNGRVAKRTEGWSSKGVRDDFRHRHGPRRHELKYTNGHLEPVIKARSAHINDEYRRNEEFRRERERHRHLKNGKHREPEIGKLDAVKLEAANGHLGPIIKARSAHIDDEYRRNEEFRRERERHRHLKNGKHREPEIRKLDAVKLDAALQNHILPRQVPGFDGFRGEGTRNFGLPGLENHENHGALLDHLHRGQEEERRKGHKNHEHKHKHHEEETHHHPLAALHGGPHHLDILHNHRFEEHRHKEHKHHEHKQRDEEAHHHPLEVLHGDPHHLDVLHNHRLEEHRHKEHKHHDHKHHEEEVHHHPLEALHRDAHLLAGDGSGH